jgi:hypothetical protein
VARITRRQFLVGGAGASVVAVGGAGFVALNNHGARRFLHGHGLLGGPDTAPPEIGATVDYGTLQPSTGPMNYGLYLPSGTVAAVLYALHGRGGDRREAFDSIGLHRFVAARNLPWRLHHWTAAKVSGIGVETALIPNAT